MKRLFVLLLVGSCVYGCSVQRLTLDNTETGRGPIPNQQRLTDLVREGDPVPSPLAFSSNFERIVIVRMTYDTDLLEGLTNAVKKENIENAVILSGIGSLRSYHVHAVSNTTFPSQNVFFKDEGPYDLTAVNGYVIRGRVHAHITFANDKLALGGHLEPGTRVFTFCMDERAMDADLPRVLAIVDFEVGGRFFCDMTDRDPEKIEIGMPVEMTFRNMHDGGGLHNYYWKCRPIRR